ncbi:MAG: DegT/DnrJ/EryC1/StrS family aminotransferase [Gemmatimonadaceae bacterium]
MNVPFLDLKAPYDELRAAIDDAVQRVVRSGWYIQGEEVRAFEQEFARYCGSAYCVGVSNGLDALHLVLRAWDIGPGDEVIVPSHTFIATWLAVTYVGATPVPVEIDASTYNLDPARVASAITARTRAIIPVHLYGLPADMDPIMNIAARHGLKVLEDAAQAHGARYRGRAAGSLGHAAAFSFYPGKNLGAMGDGGAVVTDDADLAQRVRSLANYGSERKYEHVEKGVNARLDEMQAAVLRAKLPFLDEWNDRRRGIAARYQRELADGPLGLPHVPDYAEPSWHLFVIRSDDRDGLQQRLAGDHVHTLIHYPTPPHRQPAYADTGLQQCDFPIADTAAREVLSLPIGPHMRADQLDHVIRQLGDA